MLQCNFPMYLNGTYNSAYLKFYETNYLHTHSLYPSPSVYTFHKGIVPCHILIVCGNIIMVCKMVDLCFS